MSEPRSIPVLFDLIRRHKAGERIGIPSICSSNSFVIDAAIRQAVDLDAPVLVEATCNQVNQFGGYSGLRPEDFAAAIRAAAAEAGLPAQRLVLGGDHLGPFPWRSEPAADAMRKALELVRSYARAGFAKLHLDASMRCADDSPGEALDPQLIADRTAALCEAAEGAVGVQTAIYPPAYVVGTEVPAPGGPQSEAAPTRVTDAGEARRNLDTFREAFQRHGLSEAWSRVIAMVVDPGVEFGDQKVSTYDRASSADLSRFIASVPRMVFEAHSTDYQSAASLRALVEDHFCILKVGPALTFAFREAIFALARIEAEWLAGRPGSTPSGLIEKVEAAMQADPSNWKAYYRGTEAEMAFARKFSRLDRIRYYWNVPEVRQAVDRLLLNLEEAPPPADLLSPYLPVQHRRLEAGELMNRPRDLIRDHITETLRGYAWACGEMPEAQS